MGGHDAAATSSAVVWVEVHPEHVGLDRADQLGGLVGQSDVREVDPAPQSSPAPFT
jgi:hypothetical protein